MLEKEGKVGKEWKKVSLWMELPKFVLGRGGGKGGKEKKGDGKSRIFLLGWYQNLNLRKYKQEAEREREREREERERERGRKRE